MTLIVAYPPQPTQDFFSAFIYVIWDYWGLVTSLLTNRNLNLNLLTNSESLCQIVCASATLDHIFLYSMCVLCPLYRPSCQPQHASSRVSISIPLKFSLTMSQLSWVVTFVRSWATQSVKTGHNNTCHLAQALFLFTADRQCNFRSSMKLQSVHHPGNMNIISSRQTPKVLKSKSTFKE